MMVGSGKFFDTKLNKEITAYRLIAAVITNGKYTIPIDCGFLFDSRLIRPENVVKNKQDFVMEFYTLARRLFPGVQIKIAADGLLAAIEFFRWC